MFAPPVEAKRRSRSRGPVGPEDPTGVELRKAQPLKGIPLGRPATWRAEAFRRRRLLHALCSILPLFQ